MVPADLTEFAYNLNETVAKATGDLTPPTALARQVEGFTRVRG